MREAFWVVAAVLLMGGFYLAIGTAPEPYNGIIAVLGGALYLKLVWGHS